MQSSQVILYDTPKTEDDEVVLIVNTSPMPSDKKEHSETNFLFRGIKQMVFLKFST